METLVISVDPSAGETNLPWAGTVDHHQQMDLVMEVLVDIDPTTNIWVPELAKSWQLSPDGTEWTFQLEEGVMFHDGWGEFTADDVFHTVELYQRDDAILAYATDWREIDLDASTKISDYEITLKLKNPNPRLPLLHRAQRWRSDDEQGPVRRRWRLSGHQRRWPA